MIISRGRRYIFVHIPKTGGTSMALALEQRAMKDDILIGDTPKAKRRKGRVKQLQATGRLWKHSTLTDIDGVLHPKDFNDFFLFSLVRNPWDRMVSYYYWLQNQRFDHPVVNLSRQMDFSGFVNAPLTQRSFARTPYGHYMTAADGREHCNAYIRLEHLENDLPPLWEHLGFKLDIPVENRSDRQRDFRNYYSDYDAGVVADICAQDISRFSYHFG